MCLEGSESRGLVLDLSPAPLKAVMHQHRSPSLQTIFSPASGRLELEEGSAHVWFVDPSILCEGGKGGNSRARLAEVLSHDERKRYDALVIGKRQDQADSFLLARTLLRGTLSRYCPAMQPREWRFRLNEHGRPELSFGECPTGMHPDMRRLRFNLSHCPGLVCLAVALGRDVGVDVEPIQKRRSVAFLFLLLLSVQKRRSSAFNFFAAAATSEAKVCCVHFFAAAANHLVDDAW